MNKWRVILPNGSLEQACFSPVILIQQVRSILTEGNGYNFSKSEPKILNERQLNEQQC